MAQNQTFMEYGLVQGDVSQLKNIAGQFESLIKTDMQKVVTELTTEHWKGAAAEAWSRQFDELKSTVFQKVETLFADLETQLNQTQAAMSDTDSQIASKFGVQG